MLKHFVIGLQRFERLQILFIRTTNIGLQNRKLEQRHDLRGQGDSLGLQTLVNETANFVIGTTNVNETTNFVIGTTNFVMRTTPLQGRHPPTLHSMDGTTYGH
jgi:hypothetical protein